MEKKDINRYYRFVLYIVVVGLINIVGLNLFFRIDLTSKGLYSLSEASKKAVSSLKEPLTINVFFTKNLPAPYNNIERYLHDLLEEYEIYSNEYLNYRFFDVSAKEGDVGERELKNRKLAQDYGIYPVNVRKIERDEVKLQKAYMGMVLIHGDVVEKIRAIESTQGLEYQITTTIQKMNNKISALLNLSEKINIVIVRSSSINNIADEYNIKGLGELRQNINQMMDKLQSKNYNQLAFKFYDPTTNPEIKKETTKYERFGFGWPQFKDKRGKTVEAGNGIVAIGLEHRGKSIERQLLSKNVKGLKLTDRGFIEEFDLKIVDMKLIETFIKENIDNLIDIHDDLGYLSSHGTLSLSASLPPQLQMMQQKATPLTKFNAALSQSYTIKQVNLKDEEIPESVDTLIIAGAKENFSDWELFQIDQFLMKGKSLAIFMDAFNEIQQNRRQMSRFNQPVYLPLNTGLEKLVNHYGLTVKKSYVLDESCFVSRDPRSGEMPFYFAPVIKNENINHHYDFMENIKRMLVIKMSPLEINEEKIKKNSLKVERLFSSSQKSWEMSGRINLMPWAINPPKSDKGKKSFPLAYMLEGEFHSYFTDRTVPEKPKKKDDKEKKGDDQTGKEKIDEKIPVIKESKIKEKEQILTRGRPGKIFLIGSSEIIKDVRDERGNMALMNEAFILNTIDYLNSKEDIAVMRSKDQRFNPLKDAKHSTKSLVKYINISGLPILVVFMGVVVWMRRKSRRKTIQMMFKK